MQLAVAIPESHRPLDPAWTLLLLLVAADLAFIVLHVLYIETSLLRGRPFSLEADDGVSEAFQYVKQFWVAPEHGDDVSSRAAGGLHWLGAGVYVPAAG
jgi:hypothetical protein